MRNVSPEAERLYNQLDGDLCEKIVTILYALANRENDDPLVIDAREVVDLIDE